MDKVTQEEPCHEIKSTENEKQNTFNLSIYMKTKEC